MTKEARAASDRPYKGKPKTETVYRLVNRDKTKIGVISHAPNCGYTDEELKNLAKRGWKIKVEVRQYGAERA